MELIKLTTENLGESDFYNCYSLALFFSQFQSFKLKSLLSEAAQSFANVRVKMCRYQQFVCPIYLYGESLKSLIQSIPMELGDKENSVLT